MRADINLIKDSIRNVMESLWLYPEEIIETSYTTRKKNEAIRSIWNLEIEA